MNRMSFFVPLGVFVVIVALGYIGFGLGDRAVLPSPLIGKPFPPFSAPRLDAPEQLADRTALLGRPLLVNVWATWCPTCKAEHAFLETLKAREGLEIVGIVYKDDPASARRWLDRYGDPYSFNLLDADGRIGVELGVYGAPESFLLDARGTIVYKRVGDVNEQVWAAEIAPRLAAMEDAS
ncbi:MAG: DsbE family thiol:disulfide interchange protein [Pseudomonadales bacterium]|nr:DsbE family thiol:disulfide interchange protein [Pseudomonadales bacterium]MCP5183158.1 DsbE family thiol:disulfide interchange protein [Pseudomonadales bacterium]